MPSSLQTHRPQVGDFFGVVASSRRSAPAAASAKQSCGWGAIYIYPLKDEILKGWDELTGEEKQLVEAAREAIAN